ncbi:MAG: efflux RND transporter periplasmic adaptor subunit, partial [Saprospiraceae bacterium]
IFEKNDMLVLQGGKEDQDTSVPAHKLKTIRTVSGYNRVQLNIEKLQRQVSQMKVYAPFDGIISEVNLQKGQQANAGTPICKIINYNTFEAVFNLTEQEAIQVRKGEQVTVSPIAQNNRTFSAKISTIQPVVSKDGLVEIRARLTNSNAQKLLEGMNLNIILQKNIPNQIIIPKSAVVLRSGREVVFTYDKKTQLAKWNYVTIAYQNDEQVAISKGIEANEEIIIKGQLNLEHDAEVVLINN